MRSIAALLGLLFVAPALAQSPGAINLVGPSTVPGAPQVTPATINAAVNSALAAKQDYADAARQTLAPRSNIGAWSVGGTHSIGGAGLTSNTVTGRTGIFSVEVPDDFEAVQIGFENDNGGSAASAYTVTQAVATASTSYGNGASAPGGTAYDLTGTPFTTMVPFQFANAGVNSAPFDGLAGMAGGGKQPGYVVALATNASTGAGTGSLSFASTSNPREGTASIGGTIPLGWFVADGLGCIAPGVTVATANSTTITLTGNGAAAVGCGNGQQIWFSPVPFGAFSRLVPAVTSNGVPTQIYSDWLALSSLPRLDGGFASGNVLAVSGTNIPGGTTLVSVSPTALNLSTPTSGIVAANAAITLSVAVTATASVSNNYTIPVASILGVKIGAAITGAGIPAGSWVTGADADGVTITNSTNTLPSVTGGAVLTVSSTIYTSASTGPGLTSLPVVSTSPHRLIMVRFFFDQATGPSVTDAHAICPSFGTCAQAQGIPLVASSFSNTNIDGVNFVARAGNGAGGVIIRSVMPNVFLRFVTRHRSVTTLQCGGFQAMGSDTPGSLSGALKIASAALSTSDVPVFSVNAGNTELTNIYFPRCAEWVRATQPSIVALWTYSDRGPDSLSSYLTSVLSIASATASYGGRVILDTDAPEQSVQINGMVVPAAVNNSVTVPLPFASGSFPFGGSGYLITGAGVPAGTTGTFSATVPAVLTLSQAATIAPGTVLHVGYQIGANTAGTTITLAYPAAVASAGGGFTVTGAGIPANTTITLAANSTTATLSQAATVTIGTVLTIGRADPSAGHIGSVNVPAIKAIAGTRSGMFVFDTRKSSMNPAQPMYACDGCGFNGIYNDDYGESLWAAGLQTLLHPMIGNQ